MKLGWYLRTSRLDNQLSFSLLIGCSCIRSQNMDLRCRCLGSLKVLTCSCNSGSDTLSYSSITCPSKADTCTQRVHTSTSLCVPKRSRMMKWSLMKTESLSYIFPGEQVTFHGRLLGSSLVAYTSHSEWRK